MSQADRAQSPLGAVILAAGDSRRMGRPKALLQRQGETFLGHWLRILGEAGVPEVRVVLGRDAAAVLAAVPLPDGQVVKQEHPEEGMLSSLRLGLAALPPGLAGCFLCPVDHPAVEAALLAAMGEALRPGHVVVPLHQGRRGHPVLFAAELIPELHTAPLDEGARSVVRADPRRVIELAADAGVLRDVDTPADLQAMDGD